MKISEITESYYDKVNKRIKKDGGRDLDKSREWYKQNLKDVEKRKAQHKIDHPELYDEEESND